MDALTQLNRVNYCHAVISWRAWSSAVNYSNKSSDIFQINLLPTKNCMDAILF